MCRLQPSWPELYPGATSVVPASAMVTLQAPVTDRSLDQSDDAMEDAKKLVGSEFVRGRCIYDRRTSYPSSCNWHPTGRHVWWVLNYFWNYMCFIPHLFKQQICQTWNAASFVSLRRETVEMSEEWLIRDNVSEYELVLLMLLAYS